MSILPDRLQTLMVDQDVLTGIDFIEVKPNQRDLWIHFLKKPNELTGVLEEIKSGNISIYRTTDEGEKIHMNIPEVPHWPDAADEHQVVKVRTARPGDFGFYTLSFTHGRIDTYFSRVRFNFKVNCPSKVDCKPERSRCPEDGELDFPIDYQARDFFSLRRALMDFASLRYAHWADNGRTADLGVMLAEVMSALGDEHSYYQDRIAREAYLETASQRRSVRRLSRLVDYHLHDGLGASTWLDVRAKSKGVIYAGLRVWAVSDNGLRQYYSVGSCLHDYLIQKGFLVDQKINSLDPHIWDEDDTCLPVGATELYLKKNYRDELYPGKLVLLETHPEDDSVVIPKRRHLVRLTEVKKCDDPLFGEELTYLKWEDEQALPWPFDMQILKVHGNIVPAVEGSIRKEKFRIVPENDETDEKVWLRDIPPALERRGPNETVSYLFSLPGTDGENLVYRGETPEQARPEIVLLETWYDEASGTWETDVDFNLSCDDDPCRWAWRRSLLGVHSSQYYDKHFYLDDGNWSRAVGYQRLSGEIVHRDYISGNGATIRFGDGTFGLVPIAGTVFRTFYMTGNGAAANVTADSVREFDGEGESFDLVLENYVKASDLFDRVSNPFPVTNGQEREPLDKARQSAPVAYRYSTFRAVTAPDYARAAELLAWVQRAGASFRWTGSWLSVFVTPDPYGETVVASPRRDELLHQLECYRQTGREVHYFPPRFADLDLTVTICVDSRYYTEDVKKRVKAALVGVKGDAAHPGFFSPDNFTFGTPLERPCLEAVIQKVEGVRAVSFIEIERRGWFEKRELRESTYGVEKNEVIRVENDPNHPDRGSLKLITGGGL